MKVLSSDGEANWACAGSRRTTVVNSDDRKVVTETVNEAVGVRDFSSPAAPDMPPNAWVDATGANPIRKYVYIPRNLS